MTPPSRHALVSLVAVVLVDDRVAAAAPNQPEVDWEGRDERHAQRDGQTAPEEAALRPASIAPGIASIGVPDTTSNRPS